MFCRSIHFTRNCLRVPIRFSSPNALDNLPLREELIRVDVMRDIVRRGYNSNDDWEAVIL